MSDTSLTLQEFFVEGSARDKSHVLLHITDPTTPSEKKVGHFFALAEIKGGTIEQIEHIQTMIDDLESGIYETDSTSEKTSFEASLEFINRRGHHLLDFGGACHIIVGTICDGHIAFAYHGDVSAHLLFQEDSSFELVDILAEETSNESQLFSAVLEGEISPGDIFFVGTPNVVPIVGAEKLERILSSTPPKQAAASMDTLARTEEDNLSYGGIIASIKESVTMVEPEVEELTMRHTTKAPFMPPTEDILQPRRAMKAPPLPSIRQRTPHMKDAPLGNQMLVVFGKVILSVLQFFTHNLLRVVIFFKDTLINLFILATNAGNQRQYVLDSYKRSFDEKKRAYSHLPIMSKVLFFATIIVAIIFVTSIFVLQAKETQLVELTTYTDTVQAVKDKRDAAESSLIYNDSERAFVLLEEAAAMIASLPEKTEEEQTTKTTLQTDIEAVLVSLRNITIVTPDTIAKLSEQNTEVSTTNLVRVNDSLIAYGSDDTTHYIVNMNTKVVESRDHTSAGSLLAADAPKEYDYVSFLTGPTNLASLDPESFTISKASIGSPVETTLLDLAIYNRRAYTLSPSSDQIYRHSPTQNGFDGGSAWLDVDVDLSTAVDIAIDGDIYVLKSTGEILKFFGGDPEPFEVIGLDPALSAPTDIWTYTDVEFIYLLEPKENRLVALNKDGSLAIQYTASEWNEPEAFVVNEETNEIYVLDDNIVYMFSTKK